MIRGLKSRLVLAIDVFERLPLRRRVEALAEHVNGFGLLPQRGREQQVVDLLSRRRPLVGTREFSLVLLQAHRVSQVGLLQQGIERPALGVVVEVAGNDRQWEALC